MTVAKSVRTSETMVETIVTVGTCRGIESFQGFLGGAKWISPIHMGSLSFFRNGTANNLAQRVSPDFLPGECVNGDMLGPSGNTWSICGKLRMADLQSEFAEKMWLRLNADAEQEKRLLSTRHGTHQSPS